MSLTDDQIDRYSRQIILPEVGGVGQQKLLAARVFLAGGATLKEWAARYLAAAGIGELAIAGADAELLAHLRRLDTGVRAGEAEPARIREATVAIVDGSASELASQAWEAGVPLLLVGGTGAGGWITALSRAHPASACPHCSLAEGNAPAPPLLATLAATEAIKFVLAVGAPLCGRRLVYERAGEKLREEPLRCRPDCRRGAR